MKSMESKNTSTIPRIRKRKRNCFHFVLHLQKCDCYVVNGNEVIGRRMKDSNFIQCPVEIESTKKNE